jgi:hypothetical protein
MHRQDQTAERCADEPPSHGKGEPPPPVAGQGDVATALLEIAGAIDRLADAIRGQRFATVVNATFEQKD